MRMVFVRATVQHVFSVRPFARVCVSEKVNPSGVEAALRGRKVRVGVERGEKRREPGELTAC